MSEKRKDTYSFEALGSFLRPVIDFVMTILARDEAHKHSGFARVFCAFYGALLFFMVLLVINTRFDIGYFDNLTSLLPFISVLITFSVLFGIICGSDGREKPLSFHFLTGALLPVLVFFWAAIISRLFS